MQSFIAQLKQLTNAMQEAFRQKDMATFARLREERFSIIQTIAVQPDDMSREMKLFLLKIQHQNRIWRDRLAVSRKNMSLRINRNRQKRHSLNNLSKAYVGSYGAGKFIRRHG